MRVRQFPVGIVYSPTWVGEFGVEVDEKLGVSNGVNTRQGRQNGIGPEFDLGRNKGGLVRPDVVWIDQTT